MCIGYFACYGTVRLNSSFSWRFPLALQSAIALFLAVASFFYLPQSPRWLSSKGRKEEASAAWDKLGVSDAEREKDLLEDPTSAVLAAQDMPQRPPQEAARLGFKQRIQANIHELVAVFKKGPRKPLIMGVFVMSMQQLSGIDGVIYVSPLLPI